MLGSSFQKQHCHFREDAAAPDLSRMRETRRARIGIHGRAVADDQKSALFG